jgi:arsenite methyltransferase
MTARENELWNHNGEYGIDGGLNAIAGLIGMGMAGLVLTGLGRAHARSQKHLLATFEMLGGLVLLQAVPSYLHSTRRGKFLVWSKLLESLLLRGDEHVLDMGCGRGAVLAMIAKLLPRGRAVGLDLCVRDPLTALRLRMRELAQTRIRYGYRKIRVLLIRERWQWARN